MTPNRNTRAVNCYSAAEPHFVRTTLQVNISENDHKTIVQWAERDPFIRKVYLFGSRARGDNNPDSDIDLAISVEPSEHEDCKKLAWIDWRERYTGNPDLFLEHKPDLWHYEENDGSEIVGPAVRRYGKLLYSKQKRRSA